MGDAVLSDSERGDNDTSLGTAVERGSWQHLILKCSKVDGSVADVELLRPDWWLAERDAHPGGTLDISVPECGIDGAAQVLALRPCPELQPTPPGYRGGPDHTWSGAEGTGSHAIGPHELCRVNLEVSRR